MSEREGAVRIGILGGTFDPIHVGHIETAREAQRALALTRILVMPARIPPHRSEGPSASMFHRFAMASMAIADLPDALVSDAELAADEPSYTASTLERLRVGGLSASQLFFITGADAFAEIASWYRYPEVLDLAHFVVVSRPGAPGPTLPARLPSLANRFRPAQGTPEPHRAPSIYLVDAQTPDVSSTDIRRRLRAGEPITGLVPPSVETHIRRHGLYVEMTTVQMR